MQHRTRDSRGFGPHCVSLAVPYIKFTLPSLCEGTAQSAPFRRSFKNHRSRAWKYFAIANSCRRLRTFHTKVNPITRTQHSAWLQPRDRADPFRNHPVLGPWAYPDSCNGNMLVVTFPRLFQQFLLVISKGFWCFRQCRKMISIVMSYF